MLLPIHSRWAWGIGGACLVLVVGVEVFASGVAWMKFDLPLVEPWREIPMQRSKD